MKVTQKPNFEGFLDRSNGHDSGGLRQHGYRAVASGQAFAGPFSNVIRRIP